MASTILDPVATTIAAFLTALNVTPTVTGTKWEPRDINPPAGVVGLPTIERTQNESQIGTVDWSLSYPVGFYFDLREAIAAQTQAAAFVEEFIKAVDANPSLSDPTVVDDAYVAEAEPEAILDETRPLLVYRCRLVLTKLVEDV